MDRHSRMIEVPVFINRLYLIEDNSTKDKNNITLCNIIYVIKLKNGDVPKPDTNIFPKISITISLFAVN